MEVHEPSGKNNDKVDNYQCEKCDKQYKEKISLVRHIKTHEELIKFGKPVVFTKDKLTNHNKLNNACKLVDQIFKGDEKVSEKVLTKYLSDLCTKDQMSKTILS